MDSSSCSGGLIDADRNEDHCSRAIRLGVWGYVLNTGEDDLFPAIDAVLSGKRFVSSA